MRRLSPHHVSLPCSLTRRNGSSAEGTGAKAAADGGAESAGSDAAVVARSASKGESAGGASRAEGGSPGGTPSGNASNGGSSEAVSGPGLLVPNNPENRYRQVSTPE